MREYGSSDGDHEAFLKSIQDGSEKSDDTGTRHNSLDNTKNNSLLYESNSIHRQSSRYFTVFEIDL
jgi:hypothetical protein